MVEKREALRTLSRAIASRLDQAMPDDQPGILSYDDCWQVLQQDPVLRGVSEIREVVDKNQALEERVHRAAIEPCDRPPGPVGGLLAFGAQRSAPAARLLSLRLPASRGQHHDRDRPRRSGVERRYCWPSWAGPRSPLPSSCWTGKSELWCRPF